MQIHAGPQFWTHHTYLPLYHIGEVNRCPGCFRSQWYVGRSTAECAFCGAALPLEHTGVEGSALGSTYWDRDIYRHGWHCGPETEHPKHREQAVWEFEE